MDFRRHYDPQVPPSIPYPEITLVGMLEEAVQANPKGCATFFAGGRVSYAQLKGRVEKLAAALYRLGVRSGDRVALMLPNLPAYPVAHFAALRLGAIVVPTNPLYVERELKHQLQSSGARTIVMLDRLYPRLEKVRGSTSIETVVLVRVSDCLPVPARIVYRLKNRPYGPAREEAGVYFYSRLMRESSEAAPPVPLEPGDTALFLYTGGTTGVSKGAVLTHRNLVVNAYQTRHWLWSIREGKEVLLCALPFFHSYGMTTGMHLAVLARSTMLLVPRFELKEVVALIRKRRPTIFCGVPAMYNAINRSPGIRSRDVSSIRLCISGGAALPPPVQQRFEQLTGAKLVEGYGLSETSPVALVNPTHGHPKSGTIGVPIPDTEARTVDPVTHAPLSAGEVGELAIRGPQVMRGYWQMPQETAQVLEDGWLLTGDMAVMDEEGFFRIVDRRKDVIIGAGMNIYPREVEEVLLEHPAVAEVAVVGIPSRVREETVKAFVVLEEGSQLRKEELIAFCQDKLARYKIPRRIEFVAELPKSALGKVLKRVLRESSSGRSS